MTQATRQSTEIKMYIINKVLETLPMDLNRKLFFAIYTLIQTLLHCLHKLVNMKRDHRNPGSSKALRCIPTNKLL